MNKGRGKKKKKKQAAVVAAAACLSLVFSLSLALCRLPGCAFCLSLRFKDVQSSLSGGLVSRGEVRCVSWGARSWTASILLGVVVGGSNGLFNVAAFFLSIASDTVSPL